MARGRGLGVDRARRRLLGGALGVLLVGACGRDVPTHAITPAHFPALALLDVDGAPARLAPPLARATLVNFWATWCTPCRAEMASLESLSRAVYPELEVIGVSVDVDRNLVREFLRKQRIGFANYLDPGSRAARTPLALAVLPETFLVAADGSVLARTRGARRWDDAGVVNGMLETLRRYGASRRG